MQIKFQLCRHKTRRISSRNLLRLMSFLQRSVYCAENSFSTLWDLPRSQASLQSSRASSLKRSNTLTRLTLLQDRYSQRRLLLKFSYLENPRLVNVTSGLYFDKMVFKALAGADLDVRSEFYGLNLLNIFK